MEIISHFTAANNTNFLKIGLILAKAKITMATLYPVLQPSSKGISICSITFDLFTLERLGTTA